MSQENTCDHCGVKLIRFYKMDHNGFFELVESRDWDGLYFCSRECGMSYDHDDEDEDEEEW